MSGFRLARLLRLRARQAEALKLEWARFARAAVEAEAQVAIAERAIEQGLDDVRESIHDPDGESAAARLVNAYERMDGLRRAAEHAREAAALAQAAADEKRIPYEERRAETRALSRLEQRWKRERHRERRRAEYRSIEEHVASKETNRKEAQPGSTT